MGITALWCASKYEEIYPFNAQDASYITDHAFDKGQVFEMELTLLSQLGFNLTFPTHLTFVQRIAQLANISNDQQAYFFAIYLCEISLIETKMH